MANRNAAAAWIAIGGFYADVLGAATIVGWPSVSIAGAVIGRAAMRRRLVNQSKSAGRE